MGCALGTLADDQDTAWYLQHALQQCRKLNRLQHAMNGLPSQQQWHSVCAHPYELQEDVQVAILTDCAHVLHDVRVPEATEQLDLQAEAVQVDMWVP